MMFVTHSKHTCRSPRPVNDDSSTLLYVDDVRTSQESYLSASTAYYRKSFALLYVDDVRTSQETQNYTACYGDSFNLDSAFKYSDDTASSIIGA
jgi:hypothetical protein